jgi:hypothetical protein
MPPAGPEGFQTVRSAELILIYLKGLSGIIQDAVRLWV